MKLLLNVLGVLFSLTGIVWILQGTGLFPVGFMAYDMRYTGAGVALLLMAVILFVAAHRRRH